LFAYQEANQPAESNHHSDDRKIVNTAGM